ncbi:monofunctional biosynthetic peptidoglycan transglycosylase [Aliiroseovarius sp.]|uniref:monofunctional biosynthetic peptidoglycan transglycosylase n=1 Tax=Aliiroseovarius sp. TaxID=1872442 RepID=UPI00261C0484|nr:monofunctional biosynthetic peptidoglycan transglycosylase [Aliiroseovarius sp.]
MARAGKSRSKAARWRPRPLRWTFRQLRRLVLLAIGVLALAISFYALFDPRSTPYMNAERSRLGEVDFQWVPLVEIAPVMARSVVAAEDANFCAHWGFDMRAIRAAIEEGGGRGASTLSQQVVKNVYLWQGRSWVRKALEALITPGMELVWSKRRIIEVYLNVAEFGEGVFGVEAAARHYFGVGPEDLSARQAALLAALLPDPKRRSAARPSAFVERRAAEIRDGAATIRRDGRATCFED